MVTVAADPAAMTSFGRSSTPRQCVEDNDTDNGRTNSLCIQCVPGAISFLFPVLPLVGFTEMADGGTMCQTHIVSLCVLPILVFFLGLPASTANVGQLFPGHGQPPPPLPV